MKKKQPGRWFKFQLIKFRRRKKLSLVVGLLVILAVLGAHLSVAYYLANDSPGDSKTYIQMTKNLLEQGVYSVDTEPPYGPTLIRLPGYSLFLAGIYALFGHDNNTAVRLIQAILHTLTCGLAGLIALNWVKDKKRRKIAAWAAFALAAVCPFIVIYAATILTETVTTFLMTAMTLTATYAFKSVERKKLIFWWLFTGLLAGCAVFLRPDSGLFAFGIGLNLVITGLFNRHDPERKFFSKVIRTAWQGTVFSVAFILLLIPWTIRNEQLFGVFQPLSPTHAEMPGEFVSHGYFQWLRTWIDDQKYIDPMLWKIGQSPIKIENIPASAFDSEDEKARVAVLIDQYNNSSPKKPDDTQNSSDNDKSDDNSDDSDNSDDKDSPDDDKSDDKDDADDNQNDSDQSQDEDQYLKISPETDAGFAQIAQERIARAPFRYYVWLPIERGVAMWFDTHSAFYSFDGELLPLKDLDNDVYQQVWLPIFEALVWIYTLLMLAGAFFMWRVRDGESRRWLLLATLMTLPRIMFFSTLENPEPRYVVELFVFTAIIGGIALARLKFKREAGKFSLEFFYGND